MRGPQLVPPPAQQSFPFQHVISMFSDELDRLHFTQLASCEQVKDLRVSLPMQRRPLSRWAQQLHVEVVRTKRNGPCPCCQETPIVNEHGRLPDLEFDHWYNRSRARAEETWAVCSRCNARLNDTEFKASVRSAFESYQLALRRAIQTRQVTLADGAATVAS
jgi:hypothetical protein